MRNDTTRHRSFAHWATDALHGLRDYFGSLLRRREQPIHDFDSLRHFLETRASFVAQTSLYGYLRTRAGMLYPQLFDNDEYVRSINVAKWYVWLACLSDLAVYCGGMLFHRSPSSSREIGQLMQAAVAAVLEKTGIPAEAGEEFSAQAQRVAARVAGCDWSRIKDDESAFSESPGTLVHRAPIVDNLKELDEEIVINSVRFRWQEIRRQVRRNLDAGALLQSAR